VKTRPTIVENAKYAATMAQSKACRFMPE
jgi:hypothetical protein